MKLILGTSDPSIVEAFRKTHYVFHPVEVEINLVKFKQLDDPAEKAKQIARAKSDQLGAAYKSNDKVIIITIHQEVVPGEDFPVTAMSLFRPALPPNKPYRFIRIDKSTKLGDFPMTNMRQALSVLGFQLAKAA